MTRIPSIVVLYVFTFLDSILVFNLIGWSYKTKVSGFIVELFFKLLYLVLFYSILLLYCFLGLNGDDALHALICMIVYFVALFYAIAKYDPHAHDKVEFKFKKRK